MVLLQLQTSNQKCCRSRSPGVWFLHVALLVLNDDYSTSKVRGRQDSNSSYSLNDEQMNMAGFTLGVAFV